VSRNIRETIESLSSESPGTLELKRWFTRWTNILLRTNAPARAALTYCAAVAWSASDTPAALRQSYRAHMAAAVGAGSATRRHRRRHHSREPAGVQVVVHHGFNMVSLGPHNVVHERPWPYFSIPKPTRKPEPRSHEYGLRRAPDPRRAPRPRSPPPAAPGP
jgi:hypothetical protein